MTGQQQHDHERLRLLEEALIAEGVLPEDWRNASRQADTAEEIREAARGAREGRGPPEWARSNDNPGNGGGPS